MVVGSGTGMKSSSMSGVPKSCGSFGPLVVRAIGVSEVMLFDSVVVSRSVGLRYFDDGPTRARRKWLTGRTRCVRGKWRWACGRSRSTMATAAERWA
jgi:hypothetical protein